jgi:SAM-dependent methyltransferase
MSSSNENLNEQATESIGERIAAVLLAQDPKELEEAFDKWATKYDDDMILISGLGSDWGRSAANILKNHCTPATHPKILDFGCGTGVGGVVLQELGWNNDSSKDTTILDGSDLSQNMLDVAKTRNCYTNLIKSTFTESGVGQDGYYYALHASGVFAPGHCPPETLDEFVRVLRVGGMAFFTIRSGYYDEPAGAEHKQRLEDLCTEKKWRLISQTEEEYLPGADETCYVFCMEKL